MYNCSFDIKVEYNNSHIANTFFLSYHSVDSHIIKHSLIIPTKCTMFIHYIHVL